VSRQEDEERAGRADDEAPRDAEGEADQDGGGERDASTRGIADALGVDDDAQPAAADGAANAADDEEKAPTNRAARRREQAVRRKKKAPAPAIDRDAEEAAVAADARARVEERDLPKDKNARAKELLKRRQASVAAARSGGGLSGLDTGEMVQDALARGSSAAGRWMLDHLKLVLGGVAIAAIGTAAFVFYHEREQARAGAATGALADALAIDRGRVLEDDKRPEEEKQADPTRVFPSSEARATAAVDAYQHALDVAREPGPTTLARLGLAGARLEKGDQQGAIDAYAAVLATPLAAADVDVRARSIEGTGLAKEAKGDLDGALAAFEELAKIDASGFEELGLYHQARVHVLKKEPEKAKELLKKAREKLSAPGDAGQAFPFLEAVVDGALRSLDPSAVPVRTEIGGAKGSAMSPEELDRLQEQLRKALEKKNQEHEGEHEGEGNPLAPRPQGEPQ
jgi:tetratricopeptide (TPR) repeat protein